ncbi:MAG: N-acetylmuramoyl-L-alanine amidase [Nannocystis sp.]|nr:N-acetylmuramoyl-L-alanine amidase [Nannocystis sp.]
MASSGALALTAASSPAAAARRPEPAEPLADNATLLADNATLLADNATLLADNATLLASLGERAPGEPALRRWQWIVVHHTAAEYATLPGIDRYHRNHFGDPLGAEYHFIINNGKKDGARRPIGSIEAARWRHQEPAWHLFKPDNAPDSLAICLVGNFETRALPGEMLRALSELTRALMKLCEIPRERVSTHRVVDEKMTQCPGKLFPREAFLAGL